MVIEGFIEEELIKKLDVLERCFTESFTPVNADQCKFCEKPLVDKP